MQCDVISMTFAYKTNLNISRMKQGNEIVQKMLLCHFKCSFKCNHKKNGVKFRCIGTLTILKIQALLAEKIKQKVYVNHDEPFTDLQILIKYEFIWNFVIN